MGASLQKAVFICVIKGQRHPPSRCAEGGTAASSETFGPPPSEPTPEYLMLPLRLPLQEPTLYTVKAVFILDNDGNRLLSKVRTAAAANDGECFSLQKCSFFDRRIRAKSIVHVSLGSLCDVTKGNPRSLG